MTDPQPVNGETPPEPRVAAPDPQSAAPGPVLSRRRIWTLAVAGAAVLGLGVWLVFSQLPRLLNQGGLAAVEIGADQSKPVTKLLRRDGLKARVVDDFAARPRAVLLTWG